MAYLVSCLAIAFIAGMVLSLLHDTRYLNKNSLPDCSRSGKGHQTQRQRFAYMLHEVIHTLKEQWVYLLTGVALSALIISFVDLDFAQKLSDSGFLGVLAVTAAGLVLHTDVVAVLPVISTLMGLQMPYGILFSLVAALAFFSIPMVIMVKKSVKLSYIAILWGIMFVLINAAGGILLLVY